ncbi:hypothetical protein LDENG_00180610 [Lucifuga dentata]|nr:hypothetical protein LDENG_00180610 [Lucifuga dentata]
MLKALEYIENLRQRTGTEYQKQTAGYRGSQLDDVQKLRDMLRLASNPNPTQSKVQAEPDEEEEQEGKEDAKSDKTEELLQAVLSTLQQTEQTSKPAPFRSSGRRLSSGEPEGVGRKEGTYPWEQQKQHGITLHKKMPLMFEDEEEGEGEEEEEEEDEEPNLERESPFKRTNENVEEKYTPQNLATLKSVFEELGKLTDAKATHKRQEKEDDMEEDDEIEDDDDDDDDDDDMFNVRNVAYEDEAMDLADWAPLEELEEEEEEEEGRNNKHEMARGLDEEEEDEDVDNDAFGEEDNESYPVKRSSYSGLQRDPDDITNLVDYYLLKVLGKTEEEEQKRELEEEEEEEEEEKKMAERRAAQYRDNIDPQAIYQLLQISQKFQIPPEDLLDMLKNGEMSNQDRVLQSQRTEGFPQIPSKKTYKSPAKVFNKPHRQNGNTPENLRTEEILNILGLGDLENLDQVPIRKQKPYKSLRAPLGRPSGESAAMQRPLSSKLKDDYDDNVDEDELAAYVAAQMLARFPQRGYKNKAGQKRETVEQTTPGSFEQAIQNYFDQTDSDTLPKRQSDSDDDSRGLENEALMKLLSYMNPETPENDDNDDDDDAKTVPGI